MIFDTLKSLFFNYEHAITFKKSSGAILMNKFISKSLW